MWPNHDEPVSMEERMAFCELSNISKQFGDRAVLRRIDCKLAKGERVGLVGSNGCGKTTLLRIIAGLEQADGGEIHLPRQASVGLLETGADSRLAGQPQAASLSGGERTLAAVTSFMANPPDLLLLDEPTSNLDFQGIQTVINLLRDCPGGMLIVSHDRYFLDRAVTRIVEIEDGRLVEYPGNYTVYRETKARIYQERLHRYEAARKEQQRIKEAIQEKRQWAEKAHRDSTKLDSTAHKTMGLKEYKRAKAMKLDKKAKNDIRRLESLAQDSEPKPRSETRVQFAFAGGERHGRRLLEADALSKSFGSRLLWRPSHFYVMREEKVAVFGPNGCGKTTLLHMIEGLEPADGGRIWLSPNARPFILSQRIDDFPAGQTILAWLTERLGPLDGMARAHLAQLGFSKGLLEQDVADTSQGERMKLKLVEPILRHCECLILDEPTNYLDLHAREMLEEALADYPGTLLVVSHDLYLLEKVCDKVLLFEGQQIRRLEQSFAEYAERLAARQ
jgi:macrolide transport system ATP-binding/permease protein